MKKTFEVSQNSRLDTFLSSVINISRKDAKAVVEGGFCVIDGRKTSKASIEVRMGQIVDVDDYADLLEKKVAQSEHIPTIVYEDDAIIVIDKPSGLTVHEGSGTTESTLVDYLKKEGFALASDTGDKREGIVHRIDRETSGLMVIAKTNEAAEALKEQFADKSAGRYYVAVIEPPLKEDTIVDAPIGRHPKNRIKMCVIRDGKESKSAFCKLCLSDDGKSELIAAKLFSGRTHQIRAHLAHIGRHILGDDLYGFKSQNVKIEAHRIMLHAAFLYFIHPTTKQKVGFFATPPSDFTALFEKLYTKEKQSEIFNTERIANCFGDTI
jgi:23S rRNA pseudouridine1911/1915/1917 synthase